MVSGESQHRCGAMWLVRSGVLGVDKVQNYDGADRRDECRRTALLENPSIFLEIAVGSRRRPSPSRYASCRKYLKCSRDPSLPSTAQLRSSFSSYKPRIPPQSTIFPVVPQHQAKPRLVCIALRAPPTRRPVQEHTFP